MQQIDLYPNGQEPLHLIARGTNAIAPIIYTNSTCKIEHPALRIGFCFDSCAAGSCTHEVVNAVRVAAVG